MSPLSRNGSVVREYPAPSRLRRRAYVAFAAGVLAALAAGGCAPSGHGAGAPIPNAASSRVVWNGIDVEDGKDLKGAEIDEIPVRGGDVLRLEVGGPIEIGERVRSGKGFAETWTTLKPTNGFVTVRSSLLATAVLAPKNAIARAHIGHGFDPGYGWFELEADVITWAKGPIPAPFPPIAPPERIDLAGLTALDSALAEAVAHAKDQDAAAKAAHAIRSVVGLRVVRALRPVVGFPYFYDESIAPDGSTSAKKESDGRVTWEVSPRAPIQFTVQGPQLLHLWSKASRDEAEDGVTLRVFEGTHDRASSAATIGRGGARNDQGANASEDELIPLRRAVVHVPPGKHTYRVEATGGTAHLVATLSEPVIHLGDAIEASKDEEALLKKASLSCGAGAPAICAMAMALGGRDEGTEFDAVLATVTPAEKQAIAALSAGGPRDPSIALELAASQGDINALKALGDSALLRVDDGLRGAWVRGTTRGTRWVTAEKNLAAGTWTSLLFDAGDSSTCALAGDTPWTEVTAEEAAFSATTWRGAPTIELMATVGCDAKGPVGLVVDGETLSPNPSAPMSKWHVLVGGKTAKLHRSDKEPGHVYAVRPEAAACGAHWGLIGAPRVASGGPKLAYGPAVRAPGVEVWLRDGAKGGEVVISSSPELPSPEKVRVIAAPQLGFSALDDKGNRWTRVARVALPTWAAAGATVTGGDDVAVRAIVRAPRTEPVDDTPQTATNDGTPEEKKDAVPLDEAQLVKLSREILAAQGDARGAKYLERALVLAAGGAAHAAMEDARAAKALGTKGPGGSEVIDYVRKAIRLQPRKPLVLPTGLKAYGVEPDFDPGAPRCKPSLDGPRGRIAALLDELKTSSAAQVKTFDAQLAIRAFEAVTLNPVDPRGPSVLSRALAGSRWMTPKTLDGNPLKVQRLSDITRDGALDPDGDLRARVGTGQPFERASYATITETRPAKASLSGAEGAKAHVEFACVARSPADAIGAPCPLSITVGTTAPLHPVMGADGRGKIELPALPPKGKEAQVLIALDPAPGRWEAIARIVLDKEVPGTKNVDGVGWVLMPPGLQYRFLVKSGEQVGATLGTPSLVRIDAIAEPEEHPKVVVVIDGKEYTVNVDGTPRIFAVPKAGAVTVKSIGGAATIILAERVAKAQLPGVDSDGDAEPDIVNSDLADPVEATAATTTALVDPNYTSASGGNTWRDVAVSSPRPLTGLEANLGTIVPHVLARYGTLRDGDLATAADGYLEQGLAYRRHVETLDAWIGFGGIVRERDGNPTLSGSALVYKQFGRLRIAGWGDYWTQELSDGSRARTVRPRAFIEYSWRLSSNVFLLPRVGMDGYYTNISVEPRSLKDIDDDVFNEFRAKHPTELFAQTLAWWVPYINDIFYLRGRATFDPLIKSLDHAAIRPGAFFALGQAEIGFYADTTWYRATEGFRAQSKVNVTGATYALYNLWGNDGSVDVQTGIGGRARSSDGGWEVFALVNVFASFHRGLRDFTSLELNFPEPLGGGVAWRGPMAGGGK